MADRRKPYLYKRGTFETVLLLDEKDVEFYPGAELITPEENTAGTPEENTAGTADTDQSAAPAADKAAPAPTTKDKKPDTK